MFFVLSFFLQSGNFTQANQEQSRSFINVVIPLRGREYWQDFSKVTPLLEFLKSRNIPVTVLIQYSALKDQEAVNYLKKLPERFELGLFLEVDESLAQASFASYLYGIGDRAHSNLILLSAYEVSERKRMLTESFTMFKKVFAVYPQSVGAWYIDSVSLSFLRENYSITGVMGVADQWNTDTYGLWGAPWGVSYIPSKYNSLVPAQNNNSDSGLVKIQWAARDPVLGYGLKVSNSTYSLQANDYIKSHKLDINYFSHLANIYLYPDKLTIKQLTIGLEAGQEGNQFLDELKRQIDVLSRFEFVTMRQFAGIFRRNFHFPFVSMVAAQSYKADSLGFWFNFDSYRAHLTLENGKLALKDVRIYDSLNLFADVFSKDASKNLERIIPNCLDFASTGKEIILAENISNLDKTKAGNTFNLFIKQIGNRESLLVLSPAGIDLAGKKIFSTTQQNKIGRLLKQKFIDLLFYFQIHSSHKLSVTPLFSKISGIYYFGIPVFPDRLIAVKISSPFIGMFKFPFQVLSKFKKIEFDIVKVLFGSSFVNPDINCEAMNRTPI